MTTPNSEVLDGLYSMHRALTKQWSDTVSLYNRTDYLLKELPSQERLDHHLEDLCNHLHIAQEALSDALGANNRTIRFYEK